MRHIPRQLFCTHHFQHLHVCRKPDDHYWTHKNPAPLSQTCDSVQESVRTTRQQACFAYQIPLTNKWRKRKKWEQKKTLQEQWCSTTDKWMEVLTILIVMLTVFNGFLVKTEISKLIKQLVSFACKVLYSKGQWLDWLSFVSLSLLLLNLKPLHFKFNNQMVPL